tara:strand:+ start:2391 stop:3053 length:663 start_codon:yes stop_codon:yes gene_type:complete
MEILKIIIKYIIINDFKNADKKYRKDMHFLNNCIKDTNCIRFFKSLYREKSTLIPYLQNPFNYKYIGDNDDITGDIIYKERYPIEIKSKKKMFPKKGGTTTITMINNQGNNKYDYYINKINKNTLIIFIDNDFPYNIACCSPNKLLYKINKKFYNLNDIYENNFHSIIHNGDKIECNVDEKDLIFLQKNDNIEIDNIDSEFFINKITQFFNNYIKKLLIN